MDYKNIKIIIIINYNKINSLAKLHSQDVG